MKPFKTKSEKEVKDVFTFKSDDGLPVLYVVHFKPEGFVVVSGSKKVSPIQAFSETGSFEYNVSNESFRGLKDWIEDKKESIERIKNDDLEVLAETQEQWEYIAPPPPVDDEETVSGGTIYQQKGPLLNTRWGQGCGYNNLLATCSTGGSCSRVLTGCVATATAQVMRYWEHPSGYNWSAMPNLGGSAATSLLMRDVGNAVSMNYGCISSSADTGDARNALVNTFGYSGYASYVDYSPSIVVIQLDAEMPVILRGRDSEEGHAWVCDGYRRNKYVTIHNPGTIYEYESYTYSPLYLSMNWGWNGGANGWYLFNDFLEFNSKRKMIVQIHP